MKIILMMMLVAALAGCGGTERVVYRSDFCVHAPKPPKLTDQQIDDAPDWAADWFMGLYYPTGDTLGCGW